MHQKPNIILILADDLGFSDLGSFGSEIQTPHLDQLAKGGLRFTQFYNSARCCPSRASLLSGLYPHQAGVGEMTEDLETPGYRGYLKDQCVTLAEVVKQVGYRTYLSGKWHVGEIGPTERGFDDFYGLLGGFTSFWDQSDYSRLPKGRPERTYKDGEFYATDAITDYALDFITEARAEQEPYFLYLSYNAPHFPLQAPKEEIAKYEKLYQKGWDKIREERLDRMKKLAIVPEDTELTPRAPFWNRDRDIQGVNPAWESVANDRKQDLVKRMAIYAGMIDRMDQNIGRVLNDLKKHGEMDNTLILFCSDNGACAEWDPWGFDNWITTSNFLHRKEDLDHMGGPDSYHSYGSGWANASSTPLQLYKHYSHEGGISTPLIAHWPEKVANQGGIDHRPGHFIDIMATLVEITNASYPDQYNGHSILPMEGQSFMPAIRGEKEMEERTFCFEHEQHCGVRKGKWKLSKVKEMDWELYDIEHDRTEMHNLKDNYPELVEEMKGIWEAWAKRTDVYPRKRPQVK
ncbi:MULTISPECIES: arylsulfatase [Virgibacillus]|uniref:Arylsulfatase n=2 Tax=Virgibacillus TaxID=84406 RepID=A0A024Q801_9BACI|nr:MULTISPECIES: arylsulfatase [Virgibacillus]EQB37862.1 arylsulfatase [Virgibacillus sp. CM-4]MYL40591.1 sulfatase-like hydrolase/transferase [Virgibacillus massiliensis]GGJ57610.1 arylsulfatase [Virgibacillus kapii]CDQ38614.1 Arylsulfatase [Virgibacillus massiliensis]